MLPACSSMLRFTDQLFCTTQFEVVFSDTYIREAEALALIESARAPDSTYAAEFSSQTDLARNVRESEAIDAGAESSDKAEGPDDPDSAQVSETFEIIKTPHLQYLCSVPVIAPSPALNQTANELAKAEEARELSRASAKGWELMQGLEGTCLYYMSGWWSYSFCYGKDSKEIVQFHALPGMKNGLPERDPESHEYVLGTTNVREYGGRRQQKQQAAAGQDNAPAAETEADGTTAVSQPTQSDLQIKGDQRYLVQRLEHGTICDLTGRPRTIDVQYHCTPGATTDRIGWIKEITTCTYLMVVQTQRLCADVAFLPPKETRAHPISCRQIVRSDEEEAEWRDRKRVEDGKSMAMADAKKDRLINDPNALPTSGKPISIGGLVVGARKILGSEDGKSATKIKPPGHLAAVAAAAKTVLSPLIDAVQKKGNGKAKTGEKVRVVTEDDLLKAGLTPEAIEEFRKEFKMAKDDPFYMVEEVDIKEGEEAGQTRQGGKKGTGKKTGESESDEEEDGSQEVFFKEEL